MLFGAVSASAQAVSGQGTWETTLQARDVGNTGTTNAFYDTHLNITWLRNANQNGLMNWADANNWAQNLSVGGTTGWRLPISGPCNVQECVSTEMGHLWYTELGNTYGNMIVTGGFENLQSAGYQSGTLFEPDGIGAYDFYMDWGASGAANRNSLFYAMAVHSGDVGTVVANVPELETYAMLLAGLGLIGVVSRRRTTKPIVEVELPVS
jgi:hypothetical protein